MGFILRILEGPEKGREYAFDRIQVTVGRTVDNDVVLPDPGISRQHLSIRDKGGAYIVRDLGSSNGTQVNGKKVSEEVLRSGDVITAGGARIRFESKVSAAKGKTARQAPGVRAAAARPAARAGNDPVRRRRQRPAAAPAVGQRARRQPARSAETSRRRVSPGEDDAAAGVKIQSAGLRQHEQADEIEPVEPAMPKKGLPKLLTSMKSWFLGLEKRNRILVSCGFALLCLILLFLSFRGGQKIVAQLSWYDEYDLQAGEWIGDRPARYGLGDVDYNCRYRAGFVFKYATGRVTLEFIVGGIDSNKELSIDLNGMHVQYAPVTLDRFSDVVNINLPRKHLIPNESNKLEFINEINRADPQANNDWVVMVSSIEESPLPPYDPQKAKEAFEKAHYKLKNKGVAPGNLYRALRFFEQARDYLELSEEGTRSDIYTESQEQIRKIEEELNKLFKNQTFYADKAAEYGRREEAKNIFRILMLTFPNQSDYRHKTARQAFINLGGLVRDLGK